MSSKDQAENKYNSEELLKRAHKFKGENFEELLKEIEEAIEKSEERDEKLLRAKKAVTARMASREK
ncbi:hypothetical protein [Methanobacterium oryzae]|uniref:hypothetical protein n=1 Tax=Methanobacterium oryzae TaxID=69540 RepID=UPI003D21104E